MEPVDEERYEITVDTHGIKDGPRLGRQRLLNKVGFPKFWLYLEEGKEFNQYNI